MKNYRLLLLLLLLCTVFTIQAQKAKKPTLMVIPSDAWFLENKYVKEINDEEGEVKIVPDYEKAFQESTDLLLVISAINGLMAERGFPLKNMETEIKGLAKSRAMDIIRSSSTVSKSAVDEIVKNAKADIIIQLTWVLSGEETDEKRFVIYNLQGLDAYTYKQIATATGSGRPSFSADLPLLLEEAVLENMEDFTATLSNHFNDMFKNGREVTLRVLTADNWEGDLTELSFEIEDWLSLKTQGGIFSTTVVTDTYALFEQVRMPLFDNNNRALAARNFFRGLSKVLSAPPYNEPNKIETEGLGEVTIILKGK